MVFPVAMLLLAGMVLYSGLHDQSITDTLRALLGRAPTGKLGSLSGFDASAGTNGTGGTVAGSGAVSGVAQIAQQAAELQSQKQVYTYTPGSGRTNDGHPVLSPPYTFDCSGFCEGCYRDAKLPDPVAGSGFTANSFAIAASGRMQKVSASQAVPGDLVVFPNHVVVYTGNGNCVSMGAQGEPKVMTVAAEASFDGRGITGYYHMKGQ